MKKTSQHENEPQNCQFFYKFNPWALFWQFFWLSVNILNQIAISKLLYQNFRFNLKNTKITKIIEVSTFLKAPQWPHDQYFSDLSRLHNINITHGLNWKTLLILFFEGKKGWIRFVWPWDTHDFPFWIFFRN